MAFFWVSMALLGLVLYTGHGATHRAIVGSVTHYILMNIRTILSVRGSDAGF